MRPFYWNFTLQAKANWSAGWSGSETREVTITEKGLTLDIGGRHGNAPVYRCIYHEGRDDESLQRLSGTLYYRPRPGLILSPIEITID